MTQGAEPLHLVEGSRHALSTGHHQVAFWPQVVATEWPRHVQGRYERFVKPAIDLIGGLVLCLLSAPIIAALAVLVLVTMGRPVFLRQERVGRHGQTFRMYKFRTMVPDRRVDQEPFEGPERRHRHKSADDPRITPVGRVLRQWSLDELPQFWNVLLGDMSLVGPRPELRSVVEEKYEPWQHLRHQVKPGVTGLWQISARDEHTLMYEQTDVDLEYLPRIGFLTDCTLLLKTVPALLGRRGV